MTRDVVLCECFARDGLQHEPDFIATGVKTELVDAFAALGFERVDGLVHLFDPATGERVGS